MPAQHPPTPQPESDAATDNAHLSAGARDATDENVETARFKAKTADGRSFNIVEMTAQEILPSTDGRLDTWRSVSRSYRTSTGTPVKLEPDGTMMIMSRPTLSVTREPGRAADLGDTT